MLADTCACDGVKVSSQHTNGYYDIEISVWLNGPRRLDTFRLKYDGAIYKQVD